MPFRINVEFKIRLEDGTLQRKFHPEEPVYQSKDLAVASCDRIPLDKWCREYVAGGADESSVSAVASVSANGVVLHRRVYP